MKHWIFDPHKPGRPRARAGTALAEDLWQDGGVMTCVGRWCVITTLPGVTGRDPERRSDGWVIFPMTSIARFTSLSKARRHARRWLRRPGTTAVVRRWRAR